MISLEKRINILHCFIVILLSFLVPISQAEQLNLQQIVEGVNLSRDTIRSGELKMMVSDTIAPRMSPEEIQEWIKDQERKLRDMFAVHAGRYDIKAKETLEKMIQDIPIRARIYGEWKEREERDIAFEVYEQNSRAQPQHYRYRIIRTDRRDIDLSTYEAKYMHYGHHISLIYDGQIQSYENEDRWLFSQDIILCDGDKMEGFVHPQFLGRSLYRLSPERSTLSGAYFYF